MGAMAASIAAMPATGRRAADAYARGALPEARRICEAILGQSPDDVAALNILSLVEYRSGNATSALALVERAIGLSAGNAHLHAAKGAILRAMGRPADAVHAYDRALGIAPGEASILSNMGNALADLGRFDEALAAHDKALAEGGAHPGRLAKRAMVLQSLGRPQEALADAERALAIDPRDAWTQDLLGTILHDLQRHEEALEALSRARELAPGMVGPAFHHAKLLRDMGNLQEAARACARAVVLDPGHIPSRYNLAILLDELGRHDESDAVLDLLAAMPGQADAARWDKSLSLLRRGEFEAGWKLHEVRLGDWRSVKQRRLETRLPRWTPSRPGDTVLAWGEQGLGDEIMFASMIPDLALRCGRVILASDRRLAALFSRSFPGIHTISHEGAASASFDSHVPTGSLGLHFRPSSESFPGNAYLTADASRRTSLRNELHSPGRPLVGISWHSRDRISKCVSLGLLAASPELQRCRLVSLQYGDCSRALAFLRGVGLDIVECPSVDNTTDIDGLAALASACDVIVTISNVTAHLAGALGIPAFLLLPFAPDWRWGRSAHTTPWYTSVRIIRQQQPGDWTGVLERLDGSLRAFFSSTPRNPPPRATATEGST
jgi:tetratricopeptide (TPR) repeat protein